MKQRFFLYLLPALVVATVLQACGGGEQPPTQEAQHPQGRIVTANQDANTLSVIDVATDRVTASVATGVSPHHVLATPDGKELWVTLYGDNRLQVFDAQTLKELASVDVGSPNDDLIFDPTGEKLYVSLGQKDEIVVVAVQGRKELGRVKVGKTPHGVRVTPDGKYLLATNTADNTLSLVSLAGEPKVEATIKTGANPFEVIVTENSATAYVSNFLGDSITVVDLTARKAVGYIRSGKKPAMIALEGGAGQEKIWVSNTGSDELWLIDAPTRKLVTRIPVGKGAHGALGTPAGKLYVTNTEDATVSVVSMSENKVLATIGVGAYPNGLIYLPNAKNN